MKFWSHILLVLLFAGISACSDPETATEDLPDYVHIPPEIPDSVYDLLQNGDIAIRKGGGPLSYHLMNSTKEDYSHCGVVVKVDGVTRVIHTIGASASDDHTDGMQMQDLSVFVANAADSMLFFCRPIFVDSANAKVTERAYYYLNQKIPFDHGFSVFTPENFYCTELLFYIFRDIGGKKIFDVMKKHKSYMLMFSTFFNEENFTPLFHLKTGTNVGVQ